MCALEMGKCTNVGAIFDGNFWAEDHVGLDDCIWANVCVMGKENCLGGSECYTCFERISAGAGLKSSLCGGEIRAGVDPHGFCL